MMKLEAVAIYVRCGEKHLLLKRAKEAALHPEKWSSAGGRMEEGETPEETAVRELLEETKIQNQDLSFVSLVDFEDYVLYLFELVIEEPLNVALSDEHTDYRWLTYSELEKMDLMPGYMDSMNHYLLHK